MSYENGHFTNLGQLKKLAQRTKSELDDLDTRVGVIEAIGPEKNVIVGIQKNGVDVSPDANRKVNIAVPTKTSELTNDSTFIGEQAIDDKISAAVAGALIPAGSVAFASLPALAKANCNHIYNVTDAFATTADFVEGAGKSYPAGTNVAIINVGTSSTPSYKYDCYTGTFDFSGFMEKKATATSGNFATFDANGQVVDSNTKPADFLTEHQDISGKADKDTDAVAGNFAMFDANGNPVDSGHKHSDYLTQHQDISGKADKKVPAAAGNLAGLDSNGNLTDSGVAGANVMQKVGSATAGNVATLNAGGQAQDGGVALSSLLQGTAATNAEVDEMITEVFGAVQ